MCRSVLSRNNYLKLLAVLSGIHSGRVSGANWSSLTLQCWLIPSWWWRNLLAQDTLLFYTPTTKHRGFKSFKVVCWAKMTMENSDESSPPSKAPLPVKKPQGGQVKSNFDLEMFPVPKVLYVRDAGTRAKIGVKIKGLLPENHQKTTKKRI